MKQAVYSKTHANLRHEEKGELHVYEDVRGNEVVCTFYGNPENYKWQDKVVHEFPITKWLRNIPA